MRSPTCGSRRSCRSWRPIRRDGCRRRRCSRSCAGGIRVALRRGSYGRCSGASAIGGRRTVRIGRCTDHARVFIEVIGNKAVIRSWRLPHRTPTTAPTPRASCRAPGGRDRAPNTRPVAHSNSRSDSTLPATRPGPRQCHPSTTAVLRGPEAVFALLLSYARQIGLNAADKVLFIADGAPWIWQRIQRLIAALGLSPTQVLGLIDFYHAAKQLSDAVKLRRWSATQRTRWLNRTRGLLKRARVDEVITALRELCRGRTAGKIRTHLNYFLKNRHRFAYTTMVGARASAGQRRRRKRPSVASSISASRAHPSIGYRRASTRFFSCGLSISPADGTVCSGWP